MVKIFAVKTNEHIEIAKELFSEFDSFIKERLYEYDNFPWMVEYWQSCKEEISGLLGKYAESHACILIANYKNKPAGCVGLLAESSDVGIMRRLYVRPEFRGFGIGKGLIKIIIEHARNIGYKSMCLHTNLYLKPAIKLYKSLGFEEVRHNSEYPAEIKDLIVNMELKLI